MILAWASPFNQLGDDMTLLNNLKGFQEKRSFTL